MSSEPQPKSRPEGPSSDRRRRNNDPEDSRSPSRRRQDAGRSDGRTGQRNGVADHQGSGSERGGRTGRGQGASGSERRRTNRRGRRTSDGSTQPHRVSRERLAKLAAARAAVAVPPIIYPEQLPVSARRDDISRAIADHQVVIVAGETGSGKTTQIPKILLELGRGRTGQIGHTQPRRIAARTVAERIAEELGTQLGGVVGYQVRFTDTSSEETLVKVMTDGILLAQIQRDPQLLAYDTIVIDEAHERSLNIDFLLGYLTRLLPQRPDLKVIITSATIDSDRFAAHFAPARLAELGGAPPIVVEALPDAAPVVEVSGRTYPVEIRYRPLVPDADPATGKPRKNAVERDLVTGIVDACDDLLGEGHGDILVFLSGEREIHDAADALTGHLGERARDPRNPRHVEILPLYARLSSAEQHRVFERHTTRRIVLATNVAETSLTVPGIHYVVDPGTARISRYSKATKVQRLPIEPVSQASANQRSGRSGRVADGIAIRLYSESDFVSRAEFTEPEILRTSLASVLLQMISVGVVSSPDEVAKFPFVEPPDTRAIRDGVQLLTELGALETVSCAETASTGAANEEHLETEQGISPKVWAAAGTRAAQGATDTPGIQATPEKPSTQGTSRVTRLTDIGRVLAQLPMDPRLARMIWEGSRHGIAREVAVIAAVLSIQDPRERPTEFRTQADQFHARFTDAHSDFLTYLNLWEYVRSMQRELSSSAFRRLCKAEYINFLRVREWQDVVSQLREMGKPLGIEMAYRRDDKGTAPTGSPVPADHNPTNDAPDHRHVWDSDTIHRALLSGLLSQIGMQDTGEIKASSVAHLKGATREQAIRRAQKQARNEYTGARGARFAIFPGSPLSKKPPAWIMAGELVETSRLWARDVARIQPEWAEDLAGSLAKRTYSEPHWSTKRGAAIVREKVLLYGIPIVADRKVLFSRVNPVEAREMFLRHALVQGEWTTHHEFFHTNRRLLAEAEEIEARSRQRGLVVDDDALFDFYDERVPDDVVSAAHFDRWWKGAKRREPELLTFTLAQLVPDADEVDTAQFPETWTQGDISLPLTYQFNPGTDADGVTVHIPVAVLARIVPNGFDWMVPGLLTELCAATIKSLPKPVRVQLVPAPDVARNVAAWLQANTPTWADMTRAGDMADSFETAFSRAALALRDVVVPTDAWTTERVERLPAHLRMTFRVTDTRSGGSVLLDESKDLVSLQRRLAPQVQAAVRAAVKGAVGRALQEAAEASAAGATPPRDGTVGRPSDSRSSNVPAGRPQPVASSAPSSSLPTAPDDGPTDPRAGSTAGPLVAEHVNLTTWPENLPDDTLPEKVGTVTADITIQGYPALAEEPDAKGKPTVALRVLADAGARQATHTRGVRRLLLTETALATTRITTRWTSSQALTLAASPYRNTEALVADLQLAAVIALTDGGSGPYGPEIDAARIDDATTYATARAFIRDHLEDEIHRVVGDVVAILTAARNLDSEIRSATSMTLLNTLTDLRDQVAGLIPDGFVSATPPHRLRHLARYLRASSYRLAKAAENPNRDAELAWRIHDVDEAYDRARATAASGRPNPARTAELSDMRWMIEELRVSLFAQQLGTDGPISEKRIRKMLAPDGW